MNKMEKDARSEESINISSDNLTVQMKSAQSLGEWHREEGTNSQLVRRRKVRRLRRDNLAFTYALAHH